MSKRRSKRRSSGKKRARRQNTSISSRQLFAEALHRRPCLWDIPIYELTVALSERCRQIRNSLLTDTFWFNDHDSNEVGWMLAKGFEVLISQSWPGGLAPGMPEKLWQLDQAVATQIAEYTASQCFDPLCRKYVEDNRGVYPSRPHGDLTLLVAGLSETVRDFLISRCSVGGDLYECLVDPLADDDNYFIDNGRPMDPASSCGDPIQDVLRLSLTIYDEDNSNDIKRKLIHFVRHDPWLFVEWQSFVQQELSNQGQEQHRDDRSLAIDQATDDFIFRATHLQGKTPIQVLIERQKDLSETQEQRMQRWDMETFCGTFLVCKKRLPFLDVSDLKNNKNYLWVPKTPSGL